MTPPEEFYVGYLPDPPALHRWLRRVAGAVLILVGLVGVALAAAHTPSAGGEYEYGHAKVVRGELELRPLHALRLMDGGHVRRILLVDQGKHGVHGLESLDGRPVRVTVTRIHRGRDEMFELATSPVADSGLSALPAPLIASLGSDTFQGEIVDGKCDLGVMNPGEGPLHRACAVRCLSGGVPPMLLIRDRAGREVRVALAGAEAPLPGDLVRQWAGAMVAVNGRLVRRDDAPILLVTEDGVRRIP